MPMLRRLLPGFGVLLVVAGACSTGNGGDGAEGEAREGEVPGQDALERERGVPPLDTAMADSAARPVVVTLWGDSLRLPADAPADSLIAAIRRMADSLQRVVPFEVLAISPAVHALQVRDTAGDARVLAARLRDHPWVAAAEVEGFVRGPGRE